MIRVLFVSCLLSTLLLLTGLVPQAEAGDLMPTYRDAEMEKRWQAESRLVHDPSPEKDQRAAVRVIVAVRNRDIDGLAAAAKNRVVHASGGVAAGWKNAAEAWGSLASGMNLSLGTLFSERR